MGKKRRTLTPTMPLRLLTPYSDPALVDATWVPCPSTSPSPSSGYSLYLLRLPYIVTLRERRAHIESTIPCRSAAAKVNVVDVHSCVEDVDRHPFALVLLVLVVAAQAQVVLVDAVEAPRGRVELGDGGVAFVVVIMVLS